MTKKEFLQKIPKIIKDKKLGYGKLEIVVENKEKVGVYYKHIDNIASHGACTKNWSELYKKLSSLLSRDGFMKPAIH